MLLDFIIFLVSCYIQQCKVVPLYGDMQIAPFNYVMRTKNYESSKWPACNSQSESIQGKILEQVDRIRHEHTNYISELAKYSNEIAISKETKRNDDEYKNLYNLALNGLHYLSKWTNTVLELVKQHKILQDWNFV